MTNYYDTLPKKRMGAGILFFNEKDEILFVYPNYKPHWEIPGGNVELDESPKQCATRELKEELGLDIPLGRLLCVGYGPREAEKSERLHFIFDGGILSKDQVNQIRVQQSELDGFGFYALEDAKPHITYALYLKFQHALGVRKGQMDPYLDHANESGDQL